MHARRLRRSPCGAIALAAVVLASATAPLAAQARGAGATLTAFESRKAEALLRDRLPCLGCHAMGGRGGGIAPDFARPGGEQRRTPLEIARMIDDPQHALPGTLMPHTPMPDEWRSLITRYVGGVPTNTARAPATTTMIDTSGPTLYSRFCAACHGARGGGDGPNASRLAVRPAIHASREAMAKRPDDSLFDTIAGGGWIMNRSAAMPAYGSTLSTAQIRALVRYIRVLCECVGPTWSTDGARSP